MGGQKESPGAFARLLKLFRERNGLTQVELGQRLNCSKHTIESYEQGRRIPQAPFVDEADRELNADGVLIALKPELAIARLPGFFRDYARLEAEAVSLFVYQIMQVPGLLQTEDYVRALLSANYPPLDTEILKQRVTGRLERQALLTREKSPLVAGFVIEESALRRVVGSPSVQRAQLHRLLETVDTRNVDVQVLPNSVGAHAGFPGSFVLLEAPDREHVVYLENHNVGVLVSDRNEVGDFLLRCGKLRSQALGNEDSAHLIERVAEEL